MLYKQGLEFLKTYKPIVIANSWFQIYPNVEYFNIGLNGIVELNELIESGLSEYDARNLLNMKLQFTRGGFKSLLEVISLVFAKNNYYVEIKNSVYIRRLSVNKYKIKYKDESIVVDLNECKQG